MKFYIGVENASGMEFNNKEEFLKEISQRPAPTIK